MLFPSRDCSTAGNAYKHIIFPARNVSAPFGSNSKASKRQEFLISGDEGVPLPFVARGMEETIYPACDILLDKRRPLSMLDIEASIGSGCKARLA